MTPPARLQAAIDVLDQYLAGIPLEKALTNWARKSRFAGSKDRAAVRDIVFQSVRCRLSYAQRGGAMTGRGLGLGYALANSGDISDLFDGSGYGPGALSSDEEDHIKNNALSGDPHVSLDVPEWVLPSLSRAVGDELEAVCKLLQSRAPVFVRVNTSKGTREAAIAALAREGIAGVPSPLTPTALEIIENPRRLSNSKALQDGLIELQDAASQAVCATVPMSGTTRVLDYCAGGGGKSLALADRPHDQIFAHDINVSRMRDLDQRAKRAGVEIQTLSKPDLGKNGPYDVVICDVPCSGSGAWRRAPEGKWLFSRERLQELIEIQKVILIEAMQLIAPSGVLVYATCSLLCEENEDQIAQFLTDFPDWMSPIAKRFSPLDGGDGFYVAHLTRKS